MPSLCHVAVDHLLEEIVDVRRLENVMAVLARGHDGPTNACFASGAHVTHRTRVCLYTAATHEGEYQLVLPVAQPADGRSIGRITGVTLRHIDATRREER